MPDFTAISVKESTRRKLRREKKDRGFSSYDELLIAECDCLSGVDIEYIE